MTTLSTIYVGLMSGTSMDSFDAIAVDFGQPTPHVIAFNQQPLTDYIRQTIDTVMHQSTSLEQLAKLDQHIGQHFAHSVTNLLQQCNLQPQDIAAIGSHGQTVFHQPVINNRLALSMQLGDPNIISELTNITVVADFRRRDIAAGGEGAPLVPLFHQHLFQHDTLNRCIINIGGIANLTYLPTTCNSNPVSDVIGFDTGPGNALLDAYYQRHHQLLFDDGGQWAQSGKICPSLVTHFKQNTPYFTQSPPKSTGKELFGAHYIDQQLNTFFKHHDQISPADIQASLVELTTDTISNAIHSLKKPVDEIYICGGGVSNTYLMQRLNHVLSPLPISSTKQLNISPAHIETMAFAWLAQQTLNHLTGNLTSVTGAKKPCILGGVYYAR